MSSYLRRRSQQGPGGAGGRGGRAPGGGDGAANMVRDSPESPQFGVGAPRFGGDLAALGGSAAAEEGRPPAAGSSGGGAAAAATGRLGTARASAPATAGVGLTPFDQRVRSVRSRIREMIAAEPVAEGAGDAKRDRWPAAESSGSEEYDTNTGESGAPSLPRRRSAGSAIARGAAEPRSGAQASATADGGACAAPSRTTVPAAGTLVAETTRPTKKDAVSAVAPQRKSTASTPATSSTTPPHSSGGGSPSLATQLVLGRDVTAHVGDRVAVIDPRVARFVEPYGRITEVRCNGERVRVEHDGNEHQQRYYNTGKGGEFQLYLDESAMGTDAGAGSSDVMSWAASPALAETAAPTPQAEILGRPATVASGSVSRRTLPDPPLVSVIEAPPSSVESSPRTQDQTAGGPSRRSRYSEVRKARMSVNAVEASITDSASVNAEANASSKRLTYSEKRKSTRQSREPIVAPAPHAAEIGAVPQDASAGIASSSAIGVDSKNASLDKADLSCGPPCDSADVADMHSSEYVTNPELEKVKQECDDMSHRLCDLQNTVTRDLAAIKDELKCQMKTSEERVLTRVLEELEVRLRSSVGMMAAKVAGGGNTSKRLSIDINATPEQMPYSVGTPVNEEPEQEYEASDHMSDFSTSRRGSEPQREMCDAKLSSAASFSPQSIIPEVSSAELADNRQRLENIGSAARRVTQTLGGNTMDKHACAAQPGLHISRKAEGPYAKSIAVDGLTTPDFNTPNFASPSATSISQGGEQDNLDIEMARLADLRRFAASVLKATEGGDDALPLVAPAPRGWEDSAERGQGKMFAEDVIRARARPMHHGGGGGRQRPPTEPNHTESFPMRCSGMSNSSLREAASTSEQKTGPRGCHRASRSDVGGHEHFSTLREGSRMPDAPSHHPYQQDGHPGDPPATAPWDADNDQRGLGVAWHTAEESHGDLNGSGRDPSASIHDRAHHMKSSTCGNVGGAPIAWHQRSDEADGGAEEEPPSFDTGCAPRRGPPSAPPWGAGGRSSRSSRSTRRSNVSPPPPTPWASGGRSGRDWDTTVDSGGRLVF